MNSFYIIMTGVLVASSCGLLGIFLLLRKMSMIGDAISHAVLPGIVIGYMLTGSRSSWIMLIGAAAFGVLTTWIIEWFYKRARLQVDASIGITFTWLFAIGVILISVFAGQVDLDQDCVLYGEIAFVPLDLWITPDGHNMGPRSLWVTGINLLIVIISLAIGFRGFFVTTFDEQYATIIGISASFWHYLLMSLVSLTTVVSFESVGAILVVAFLIVPPATAYILAEKLRNMFILTLIASTLSAVLGYYLAVFVNGSIAGSMAVVSGILFIIALIFSPTQGLLTKYLRRRKWQDAVH